MKFLKVKHILTINTKPIDNVLYSILPIPSTERTTEMPSHTVLIQKSLRQSPV